MSRRLIGLAPVLLMLPILAACGGGEPSSSAETDSLVVATGFEPGSLDPHKISDKGTNAFYGRVYEQLYTATDEGIVPNLAASMPTLVEGSTYQIKLLPDVVFSEGSPFNADSVVFSLERVTSPEVASGVAGVAQFVSTKKVDDLTVEVELTAPNPLLANDFLQVAMLPNKPDVDFTKLENVIGTGPYKMDSYTPGEGAELVYNDKYRGEEPSITKVDVRVVSDVGTRISSLQAGEVDVIDGVSPTDAKRLDNPVAAERADSPAFVLLDTTKGVTADKRVRQAMNYAVDKDVIIESLFGSYGSPNQCAPSPLGSTGLPASMENPYDYDPAKAEQLIEEAGAQGAEVELVVTSGIYPEDRAVGQLMAEDLEAVGLKIKLRFLSVFPDFIEAIVNPDKHPPMVLTFLSDVKTHVRLGLGQFVKSPAVSPLSRYGTAELDAKIDKAQSMEDQEAAAPLYEEILRQACDDAAFLYLYDFKAIYGLGEGVEWQPGVNSFAGKMQYDEMSKS
jgi:peptide/nickel transport system substrate-binding protein